MSLTQPIKICGIRDPQTARVAIEAGADYIGIVFYPGSHRYVEIDQAREVARAAQSGVNGRQSKVVGLFVNEPLDHVLSVRNEVGLDILQLSGNESPAFMRELARREIPFIGTVRAGAAGDGETRSRFNDLVARSPYAVLLDTHVPGMWGGSGVVGDWSLAQEFAAEYRLFLAGGLDPSNVEAAVREVAPFVVDVSTGVETDKEKDHSKIRAFIAAARGPEGEINDSNG